MHAFPWSLWRGDLFGQNAFQNSKRARMPSAFAMALRDFENLRHDDGIDDDEPNDEGDLIL